MTFLNAFADFTYLPLNSLRRLWKLRDKVFYYEETGVWFYFSMGLKNYFRKGW